MIENKQAGLVLEGGGTRGVFTSGALDYLIEKDIYFPYVIGASAGACNAVDYVAKQFGRTRDCMIHKGKENGYMSLKHTLKTKSLFDMDMIFDKYPNEIYPFDYDTYFHSPIRCELVVTNCNTGKAEYLDESCKNERLMNICRASSSIPLAGPMVTVDGNPYLDGGIADSIPIIRALKTGHRKNVIILTRNEHYRKSPLRRSKKFYIAAYGKKYPSLVRSIIQRAAMYNKTLSYIEKWEREGRVFVLRPQLPEVSRTERSYDKLLAFYQHGYDEMKEHVDEMLDFLSEARS